VQVKEKPIIYSRPTVMIPNLPPYKTLTNYIESLNIQDKPCKRNEIREFRVRRSDIASLKNHRVIGNDIRLEIKVPKGDETR
jgi:hypothetical protein